jgi:hypothetical protein
VSAANEQFALRSPSWVRTFGAAFAVAWVYPAFFPAAVRDAFLLPGAIIAVLVVAVVARMSASSVVGTGDGRLTVRNVWSTRTFQRVEIHGVGIDRVDGRLGRARGWALFLALEDGTLHRLDVTETPFLGPCRGRLERQADELRAWIDGRPQPFS